MDNVELAFTPATELARLIRDRKVSPVEALENTLARIERINPAINAYVTVAVDAARAAASQAEEVLQRGQPLGPLHGIPVAIKDLTPTAGIRTTFGSRLFENNVPTEDALIVTRLKAAGAIVVGKTNTPEFGAGSNTTNAVFGPTRNPWDTALSPGGSSGGSAAALAAGLCPIAEGSDHGGSLRGPASLCGVIGFRTSAGRVPKYPSGWLYDTFSVTGPMARTVGDTALMLSVVAGPDDRVPIAIDEPGNIFADAARGDVAGMRVAWSRDLGGLTPVSRDVSTALEGAARTWASLGCEVVEDQPDLHDAREMIPVLRAMRNAATHQHVLDRVDEIDNTFCREFLEKGKQLTALEVARAEAQRSQLYERTRRFFERYDLLVLPTSAATAFRVEQPYSDNVDGLPVSRLEGSILTYAITMTGLPAISIPCGFSPNGMPVGMQIVGRRHAEATVLRAAAAFERAAPWAHRRPPLALA